MRLPEKGPGLKKQQHLRAGTVASVLRVLALCVVVLGASASHSAISASGPISVNVALNQPRATVSTVVNRDFIVRIPSQPGTGYAWRVIGNPRLVQLTDQSAEPANPSTPAKPGRWETQVFRFYVNSAGKETIRFGYLRPWEKKTQAARLFALQITAAQE
jgi:inhibitor of cysteine peptidase